MIDNKGAYFVTGIGTDVGKTVVSAVLAEALNSFYWKPIQSGDLTNSDSIKLKNLTSNVTIIPERYRLTNPLSPHTSSRLDGVEIDLNFILPQERPLIVEGAGGILVPINDSGETVLDVVKRLTVPVIVVVKHYLGSINHTLLTIEQLKRSGVVIAGIVVTGDRHEESEKIIQQITGLHVQLYIPYVEEVNHAFISQQADLNREKIQRWLLG